MYKFVSHPDSPDE